jgi:small subunit ribosomal protein S2
MFYIVERWLGGTLTNFSTIKKSIRRLIIWGGDFKKDSKNKTKKEKRETGKIRTIRKVSP